MATKIIEYAKNKKMYGSGNSEVSGTINIEANGIYGVAKYATANVNVPTPTVVLQEKTVTENGVVTADAGYDGLSRVTVNVASNGDGEDTATLNALIDGSLTEIESGVEQITTSAFRDRTALGTVNFPNVTYIGPYAFYGCQTLSNVNIPNTTSIGE